MSALPTTAKIVHDIQTQSWVRGHNKPSCASGRCYLTSARIVDYYSYLDNPLPVAFARHYNDPEGRYLELGQYSNHYAIWHPEERLVVDFTLRQFAPTSAYPWVGTYSAWLKILTRAWGLTSVKQLTRSRGLLCPDCAQVNCNPYDCTGEM